MTKVIVPGAVLKLTDTEIQVCGGAGVSPGFSFGFYVSKGDAAVDSKHSC